MQSVEVTHRVSSCRRLVVSSFLRPKAANRRRRRDKQQALNRACRIIVVMLAAFSWVAGEGSPPLPRGQKWVASWTASVHGPYPSGNPVAQPVLDKAFESAERGAVDQTFRLIVRPSLWGPQIRLRFANTFGNQAVTLDDVFVGLQSAGGVIAAGTNQRVSVRQWQDGADAPRRRVGLQRRRSPCPSSCPASSRSSRIASLPSASTSSARPDR